MKKILTILFMAFIFPLAVSADMDAPPIRSYEAIVTNPKGAKCYSRSVMDSSLKATIPYGEKVEVIYEFGDNAQILYNDEDLGCEVALKDIKVYEETYTLREEDEIDKIETSLVVSKKGANIYSGPSKMYNKLGNIPYNTQLEFEYAVAIDDEYEDELYVWIYVEYEGIKGWICTVDGEVVIKRDNPFIISDLEIFDENNKLIAVIPKFTEITNIYRFNVYYHYGTYYIIYNDVIGYADTDELVDGVKLDEEHSIDLDFDAELIEDYWSDDEKVIAKIPAGTELVYNIYGSDGDLVIYTSYNGQQGWVYLEGMTPGDVGLTEDEEYEDEVDEPTEEPLKPVEEKKKLNGKDFVILCVGGAIVVALTAVVTIILINKNKKKKVKDVVTEVKSVEEATPVEPVVEQTPVEEVKQEEKI